MLTAQGRSSGPQRGARLARAARPVRLAEQHGGRSEVGDRQTLQPHQRLLPRRARPRWQVLRAQALFPRRRRRRWRQRHHRR